MPFRYDPGIIHVAATGTLDYRTNKSIAETMMKFLRGITMIFLGGFKFEVQRVDDDAEKSQRRQA